MRLETLARKTARFLRLTVDQYWSLKISAPPGYDVVLAGSSRVFKGLSPRHMARVLKGRKIINFGFSSCMLDRRYLGHARSLLQDGGRPRILVLGISPHTLIRRPAHRCWYEEWADKPPIKREELWREIFQQNLNGLAAKRTIVSGYRHLSRGVMRQRHYADGWVATRVAWFKPLDYVQRLEHVYSRYPIDPSLVDEMLLVVTEFIGQGIMVFGYIPPTNSTMRTLENRVSGLDQKAMVRGFTEAGGIFLDIPQKDYCAFDGSHLDHVQAKRLSRQVALMIKDHQESLP